MRAECIQAVTKAVGHPLNQTQIKDIEDRISGTMRNLARGDPEAWRAMSQADRLDAAAKAAGTQLIAEANKAKQRVALRIIAHDTNLNRYASQIAIGRKPFRAVAEILLGADRYIKGVSREYFSDLMDTFNAVEPRLLGLMHDAKSMRDLVYEIYGRDTGNPIAKKGAKVWLETAEAMRLRFNRGGGDVGKLDYAYAPQPHDPIKVGKGGEAGQERWISSVLPKLNRDRYVNADGTRFNDEQLTDMLRNAWESIATEGRNKLVPGAQNGTGARANRHGESREIHFKGPDEYLAYMEEYGKGTMIDAMQGHIAGLSRDVGLVEYLGPNPEQTFKLLHDTAEKTGSKDYVGLAVTTKNMWEVLTGRSGQAVDADLAQFMQGVRNIEVTGKLQSALLSSITDLPTLIISARFNKLPVWHTLGTVIKSFGGEYKDYANRAGMIAESLISDMVRWGEGNLGSGWTARLANLTMKASLLNAWTDALRRGYALNLQAALGKMTRTAWDKLEASDRGRLERQGITGDDWAIWQRAELSEFKGMKMLTRDSIRAIADEKLGPSAARLKDQAVAKYLGFIADESEFASVGQDLMTRAFVSQGTQRGTVAGELTRSFMLFKGFPLAMIHRHWMRAADQWKYGKGASRVEYGAALIVGLTIFGAHAMTLKDIKDGKDPRDATTPEFWAAAFSQGGGLGIMGDLIYTGAGGNDRFGRPNWSNFAGPVFGSLADLVNLPSSKHPGADALRLARGHLPFVNLWYAKTALDRAMFDDMNEYLSPGYKSRMRSRANKDWGQQYWWAPGDLAPERGPDLAKTAGD